MPEEKTTIGARTIWIANIPRWNADGECTGEEVWVVSQKDGRQKARLPVPPMHGDVRLPMNRFFVSPDERIIIGDRKLGSGINEAFVFERTQGVRYRLANRVSLNERICKKYGIPRALAAPERKHHEQRADFVVFHQWQRGGRDAVFACLYGEGNSALWYLVTLDTYTGALHHYQSETTGRNGMSKAARTK